MSDEQTSTEGDQKAATIAVTDLAVALGVEATVTGEDVLGFIGSMREQLANAQAAQEKLAAENAQLVSDYGVRGDVMAEVATQFAAVQAERDTLAKQLTEATAAYQVEARSRSGKARAIGPVKGQDPDVIEAAIADSVELVFSDGKKEITGIDARAVTGAAAWARHPAGWMLYDRVQLAGPAMGEAAYQVAGVGMLVDGKQIAWCALFDAVSVPPGGTVELRDSIIF